MTTSGALDEVEDGAATDECQQLLHRDRNQLAVADASPAVRMILTRCLFSTVWSSSMTSQMQVAEARPAKPMATERPKRSAVLIDQTAAS